MFKANATAELNRLIELPVPRDTAITQSRGKTIDAFIRANHGHVGREFLRALMSRYDDLQGMVNSASQQVEQLLAARADERFAVATMAVAGVAGRILKDLGQCNDHWKLVLRSRLARGEREQELFTGEQRFGVELHRHTRRRDNL